MKAISKHHRERGGEKNLQNYIFRILKNFTFNMKQIHVIYLKRENRSDTEIQLL